MGLSASSRSNSSVAHGFIIGDEPITLFRSELERLQYILHFPEEVAFQLSTTEYQLFYGMQPMDYVRYVSCDLTSVPAADNPSPVRNLVKRLSEVSSWITHVIVSMPTHEDRKTTLTSIIRMIDVCWNIGNFNAAVEILIGLRSEKLRPFWLSLKPDDKRKYEEFCDILLPGSQTGLSTPYREAIQRALRMPQCRLIPFFGIFLRDLYAIVNDVPSVVMISHEGETDKLEFMKEQNGDDHYSSKIAVGGLLNPNKINLVAVVLDNLELFYRHKKNISGFVVDENRPSSGKESRDSKGYEPVQPVRGVAKDVTLVPLDTNRFDLDVIQRLHHGTTVIHYDPDTGRSSFCLLKLDPSCSLLSWHKVGYLGSKESKDKVCLYEISDNRTPATSPYARSAGAAHIALDDGFIQLCYVKSIESVDSYDVDIEGIYRRHTNEEMSIPMLCWTINFGCHLPDNEFLYFIAPQQSAHYWITGLSNVISQLMEQQRCADRRVIWLKKLYLRLLSAELGPRPWQALQAFGLENVLSASQQSESLVTVEPAATKSRLKQMTNAVTRRMKAAGRAGARSESPQPLLSLKFFKSLHFCWFYKWHSFSYSICRSKNVELTGLSPLIGKEHALASSSSEREYHEKSVTLFEFVELYKLFSTKMRKDLNFKTAHHINEKQQKIYNALALASVNSVGLMDTSRSSFLTPAMLKRFIELHQMEVVDDEYAIKLIQEHEPDAACRNNHQLSFEGFVRYMMDSSNYAFIPEAVKPDPSTLDHPLSYYFICSSHNTYLSGHQLKGESSAEMYRQVLLTGCRCVELDCWDGDDGLPQIFHGHTLTSKIGFRQVLSVIKKSAFVTSNLPVVLSIENHCSLQQQARMAQMFRNYLGESLVTNFLFEADYSDRPRLPSPWQLRNKILIKNKKMVTEPSAGLQLDKSMTKNEAELMMEQAKFVISILFHFYTFLSHYAGPIFDLKMDDESASVNLEAVTRRPIKKAPRAPIAPELSELVIYAQAVKFKGFPGMTGFAFQQREEPLKTAVYASARNRTGSNLLSIATPPRRLRSTALSSSSLRPNSNAPCYQVTSLNEPSAKKLTRKHPLKCIAFSRNQLMRTYPSGMRIDSSNFNPVQYWAFGIQMVALNFQTADTAMAVNAAMFEQTGNSGYILKPRVFWDDSHPYYNHFNPYDKDVSSLPALLYTVTVISGQHICPNQHSASSYVEMEIIGIPADCAKEKSKIVSRNSVNPIWNHTATFRIVFVDLAFLRVAVCDSTNGRYIFS
ncbi:unnamed protein product [Gongylonema pulchrum]|uniref:Phosphoinositide phospholipase C n=1 Tax=Gongylonema pulchrum TaxID=637853 RepID=A0A183CU69_9BILA|nr:unnamed protein product [Gongylonema pulchrum]